MWLMIFGRPDQRLGGWVLMLFLSMNLMFWILDKDDLIKTDGFDVFIQSLNLILLLWLAMVGNYVWHFILAGVIFLQFTCISLVYYGLSLPISFLEYLQILSSTSMPIVILAEEMPNLSRKAIRWFRR